MRVWNTEGRLISMCPTIRHEQFRRAFHHRAPKNLVSGAAVPRPFLVSRSHTSSSHCHCFDGIRAFPFSFSVCGIATRPLSIQPVLALLSPLFPSYFSISSSHSLRLSLAFSLFSLSNTCCSYTDRHMHVMLKLLPPFLASSFGSIHYHIFRKEDIAFCPLFNFLQGTKFCTFSLGVLFNFHSEFGLLNSALLSITSSSWFSFDFLLQIF